VLIVRVHPEILRGQGLSEELINEKDVWENKYESIIDLEKHLDRKRHQNCKDIPSHFF